MILKEPPEVDLDGTPPTPGTERSACPEAGHTGKPGGTAGQPVPAEKPGGPMTTRRTAATFTRVEPMVDLRALDDRILALWDETDAFATSVEMRPPDSEYTFYDGPPFSTGSPHYGHILQGVVKDIVPRYWTMRGHRVERRFGWDTHGLPVEMEVQKRLGVSSPAEIEELGVPAFNQAARDLVRHITGDWYDITRRIGRWVDFENDYKTMDPSYMESVWWVFRQLWDRGLIYKTFKVVPYSWGAATPLSNFEVNLGGYRDVDDPSVTVKIEVAEGNALAEPGDELLVWTTTPWTLPGNLAVAVGEDIEYVRVRDGESHYWAAGERLEWLWPDDAPEILTTAAGRDLLGELPPRPGHEQLARSIEHDVRPAEHIGEGPRVFVPRVDREQLLEIQDREGVLPCLLRRRDGQGRKGRGERDRRARRAERDERDEQQVPEHGGPLQCRETQRAPPGADAPGSWRAPGPTC